MKENLNNNKRVTVLYTNLSTMIKKAKISTKLAFKSKFAMFFFRLQKFLNQNKQCQSYLR